jgi:hypothetical protein
MWDFVMDKLALGQVFSENFGFPCQSTFHLLLHNHLHYTRGWHNRPGVAAVPIASQSKKYKVENVGLDVSFNNMLNYKGIREKAEGSAS